MNATPYPNKPINTSINRLAGAALSIVVLASCSSQIQRDGPPIAAPDPAVLDQIPNAQPRYSPPRAANQRPYTIHGTTYYPMAHNRGFVQRGEASWYGRKFHGRKTASGETYDMYGMTAAHKRLPLPSYVEIRNLENQRRIVVRVNDRGPFYGKRIIDLSYAAAYKLGLLAEGTGQVEVRAITPDNPAPDTTPVPTQIPPAPDPVHTIMYVQIGAFRDYANAQRLQQRLQQQLRWPVRIVSTSDNRLHRVQTGPIPNVSAADQAVVQLGALGIADAHVSLTNR